MERRPQTLLLQPHEFYLDDLAAERLNKRLIPHHILADRFPVDRCSPCSFEMGNAFAGLVILVSPQEHDFDQLERKIEDHGGVVETNRRLLFDEQHEGKPRLSAGRTS